MLLRMLRRRLSGGTAGVLLIWRVLMMGFEGVMRKWGKGNGSKGMRKGEGLSLTKSGEVRR